jgi:thiol-disulfide isomerase/thioredoxin
MTVLVHIATWGVWLVASAASVYFEDLNTERLMPWEQKKPALFVFIQPKCAPCKKQLEEMKCVHSQWHSKVDVFGVRARGEKEDLKRSLRGQSFPFPIVSASNEFLSQYAASSAGTPFSVLVGQRGQVALKIVGPKDCAFWSKAIGEGQL